MGSDDGTSVVGAQGTTGIVVDPIVTLYVVTGAVSSPSSASVGQVAVRLVDKNVGGDEVLTDGQTSSDGSFALQARISSATLAQRNKTSPDLQVQAMQGDAVLASSIVRYGASTHEVLEVVLSATAQLASEFESLAGDLTALYSGSLADLEESEDRQDITYLANKSGWDARAVAMASLATQFAATAQQATPVKAAPVAKTTKATRATKVSKATAPPAAAAPVLEPAHYYALMRSGLPTDPGTIHQTSPDLAVAVWQSAATQNIIPASLGDDIDAAKEAFIGVAAAGVLTATPQVGPSKLGDLLGLQFGANDANDPQQQFAELLVRYGSDPATLWAQTDKAFSPAVSSQLQLLGQLAYMTANNAPLIAALHEATANTPLTSGADLVATGFYDAARWQPLLANVPVPSGFAGDTEAEQQAAYADFLAAQIRLSYPTATVGQMATGGALGETPASSGAGDFLISNQEFDIGDEPIAQYLDRTQTQASDDAVAQISRIQRTYQITSDASSLTTLLQNDLDSAYAVTRLTRDEFVANHGDALGGATAAQRIYDRASLIHASTLHVALSYLSARRQPAIGSGVLNNLVPGLGPVPETPTHAQATLESLFGDLDYAQCDDCGSITSPAAYMVDLLDWLNHPTPTAPAQNPRDVLLARRPDIGALPLTCANTNIALPYIDLANEVLEYYVGNTAPNQGSLTGFTGYSDDGTISSPELEASPQNDDNPVAQAAYATLKGQFYPEPLPFYRDLELLRQHLSSLGIGLYDLMLAMRRSDDLPAPGADATDPNPYGMRDILLERLGLSRLEAQMLTDSTLGLARIYGDGDPTALATLQEYSRVTGVAYTDIVSILQTTFVNPAAWAIPLLDALALGFATLSDLNAGTLGQADFEAQLPAGLDTAAYGPDGVAAWVTANFAAISSLVVIDVAGAPTDTTQMSLQHLDGTALTVTDFVRLQRFIRLWRKLGLTIQQTDDLISALYESTAAVGATDLQQLDSGFTNLLARAGIAYQAIDLLDLDPTTDDLQSLLACWAPIATSGPNALYARMFLNPTVLRLDPAFAPDVNGRLFTAAPALLAHQPAVMAALNLTGGEFALITGAAPLGLGYDAGTALSLDALSEIYRRAWLARTLGLSVLELLSLIASTQVDPFAAPTLTLTDPVVSPLLDFVGRVQALDGAGLTPTQALYLLWNTDLTGVSAPSPAVTEGLALALRAAFVGIDSQFSVGASVTPATAQSLMALVLGATAAGTFFGLVGNTFTTSVPFGYEQATLPADVLAAAPERLLYDDLAKQLSFQGFLDATTLAAVQAAAAGDATLLAGLTALSAANAQAVDAFFSTYDDPHTPYLKPLFDAYIAAVTAPAPADPGAALATLLDGLLPVLGDLRRQEQALVCATAAAGCDPSFAPALLISAAAIPAADAASTQAGVGDLTALDQGGLSVAYYLTDDTTKAPDQTSAAVTLGASDPLPASTSGTTIAASWTGAIGAAQDGDYNLRFSVDTGATVALTVDGQPVALASTSSAAGDVWANTAAIALKAGALTPIEITASGLATTFDAQWETVGVGWQQIPAQNLYSQALLANLTTTTLRFLKATALASDLALNPPETAYLATAAGLDVGGGGWLATLGVAEPAPAAAGPQLTAVLDGLCTYAALKATYSPRATDIPQLLQTLQDMTQGAPAALSELLSLTGWDPLSLQPLLGRLFGLTTGGVTPATSLTQFAALPGLIANLQRLADAFALVTTCGLSASTLIEAATNDPSPTPASTVLADVQSAVRSRYTEPDWLAVVEPINDTLRERQRDALVAYILVQSGPTILAALGIAATPNRLATADDLFNYFLLDVETEPCMLTSRIRLALSCIQLFVERCLRNMEPSVDAGDLAGSEWDWRKRYRVWQANREVFLWPENWLDETLRDDPSPPFKTTMSALLQSDVDDDAAVAAYLDYLSNLELVAKLDPVALYHDPVTGMTHVLARTGGAHRKHYYRRLANGAWTPWEEVKLNIEDVPVALYVWNGRLLLFWMQVHYQSSSPDHLAQNLPSGSSTTQTLADTTVDEMSSAVAGSAAKLTAQQVHAALYFSEYYNGAWQPTKSSDVNRPLSLGAFQHGDFDRTTWFLRPWVPADPSDESLYVQVTQDPMPIVQAREFELIEIDIFGWTGGGTGFVLHNTHSEPVTWSDTPAIVVTTPSHVASATTSAGQSLTVTYGSHGPFSIFGGLQTQAVSVVTGRLPQRIVAAQPSVDDQWTMPFFFGDGRSSFYVTPSQRWVPINIFTGFGVSPIVGLGSTLNIGANAIPPLVVPVGPRQPDPPLEVTSSGIDVTIGEAAVQAGGLKAVIGGGTNVTFQGRSIGVNSSFQLNQALTTDGNRADVQGEK